MSVPGDMVGSGAAAEIVLLVMAAELALLCATGRPPHAVLLALLPGAGLVLALWAALAGAAWWWIALPLAGSLPLHLADLRARGWLAWAGARRRTHRRIANGLTWNKGWRSI